MSVATTPSPVALDTAHSARRVEHTPPAGAAANDRASALLGWAALALVLVAGVPIFLCTPVWFDTYHYDICGRTLLRGGVLYRDVFDNNLPGIIWLQTGVRLLFGYGSAALRLADLLFFSAGVLLLMAWVPRGARVWMAAALYAFYLFVPETVPAQRDLWMLPIGLAALALRRRQVRRLMGTPPSALTLAGWAAGEGLVWGANVWLKPFVVVPALACWLVGILQVRREATGRARPLTADAAGLLAGGVLAGALGLVWLWRSGSWPYFWEIFLDWNKDYAAFANRVRVAHWTTFLLTYAPWSAVPVVAAGLAMTTIKREVVDAPSAGEPRPRHALLAAFFLAWLFQALCLQLPHDYPIVAALIPGSALIVARWRWQSPTSAVGRTARLCLVAILVVLWIGEFRVNRVAHWADCCREGNTPRVQSLLLTQKDNAYAPDPAALARVADYLRGQNVRDGELTCMSGCTHPLYLELNLRPSTRFPQVEMTALFFIRHRDDLVDDLNASRQRYVVTDLVWTGLSRQAAEETNPDDPLALPAHFPEEFVGVYPWTEPVVFRSGRYLVHRATGPASHFWREDEEEKPKVRFKNPNDYLPRFEGKMSYRDEEAARASVAVIDELYREAEQTGDRAGQHQAQLKALSMADEARWAGKEREAEVFRSWLRDKLGPTP
jgi:hypothetical protein